jgi:DNA-binding CsgD family transcriptional regulator
MAQVRRRPLHPTGDSGHQSQQPPSLRVVVETLRRPAAELPPLTKRELECLEWCAEGKSYWETAVILGISERTVSFHMEAMRAKLGAGSNAHAVAMALRAGMLDPGVRMACKPRQGLR